MAELDEGLEPDEYVEHDVAADEGPDTCPLKLDFLAASVGLMKANKTASKKWFSLCYLEGIIQK